MRVLVRVDKFTICKDDFIVDGSIACETDLGREVRYPAAKSEATNSNGTITTYRQESKRSAYTSNIIQAGGHAMSQEER